MINLITKLLIGTLALTFIVWAHEMGHYIAAKLLGLRIGKKGIGMGPKLFEVFGWEIRLFPIGAYVHIVEVDEAYRVPWWKTAITSFAGPFMNIVIGVILLYIVAATQPIIYVNAPPKPPFEPGDKIVAINGQTFQDFEDYTRLACKRKTGLQAKVTIIRDGKRQAIDAPLDVLCENLLFLPIKVVSVLPGGSALVSPGDLIVGCKGAPDMPGLCVKQSDIMYIITKDGKRKEIYMTEDDWSKFLFVVGGITESNKPATNKQADKTTKEYLTNTIAATKEIVKKHDVSKLGSIIGAIYALVTTTSWRIFLLILGVLSLSMGIINLIPIPPLDGSKIVFGGIKNLAPSAYILVERIMFLLILGLLLYLVLQDLFNIALAAVL